MSGKCLSAKIDDVSSLCRPLFDNTDIDYMSFGRIYPDSSVIHIQTYPEWHDYIYGTLEGKFVPDWSVAQTILKYNSMFPGNISQVCMLPEVQQEKLGYPSKIHITRKQDFNLSSLIMFANKTDDYIEAFYFGSKTGRKLYNFYLGNLDILEQFMLYFKERGSGLISENEKNKIELHKRDEAYKSNMQMNNSPLTGHNEQKLLTLREEIQLDKYPLYYNGKTIYISRRVLVCLQYIAKGYSMKDAANYLGISARTVEEHIQTIKRKLGVFTRKQLVDLYYQSNLSRYNV